MGQFPIRGLAGAYAEFSRQASHLNTEVALLCRERYASHEGSGLGGGLKPMTWKNCKRLLVAAVLCFFSVSSGGSENALPDVKVELNRQGLSLRVTVRSRSENRVSLAQWRLPWGAGNPSMHFVPVDSDGVCIGNGYFPREYPDYRKVSVDPNGSISGEIDLQRVIPDLSKALKKSDVHLFWVYETPEELQIAHYSGGWVLIPQQK